ncbi:unnamed protein product [Sphagnum tenellum]
MANYNLNCRHTWPNVLDMVKRDDVPTTAHDLVVGLLGQKVIKALMDSQWHMFKEVASTLKIDVEESSATPNTQEEQVASPRAAFQVRINPAMGPEYRNILENLQNSINYLRDEINFGVRSIITNQNIVAEKIINMVIETSAKNQNLQKQLQKELWEKLNTLMVFNVQLQQRKFPRLAYFVEMKQSYKTLITSIVPGLECAQLHLMCEHIDGIHVVKDQKGFEVVLGNETFSKMQPLVEKGLWILSILLKMGAHFTTGLASLVPNLNVDSILGGAPTIIPSHYTRMNIDNITSETSNNRVAAEWLVETMTKVRSIATSFDLHKVRFRTGRCEGQVAWVCGDCMARDRSLQEIQ